MSSPYSGSRHSGLSYANVAAGQHARNIRAFTNRDQAPNTLSYAQSTYHPPEPERAQMARLQRTYSVRAELENDNAPPWQRQGGASKQDEMQSTLLTESQPPWFVPSYLSRSRHLQRLRQSSLGQDEQRRSDVWSQKGDKDSAMTSAGITTQTDTVVHRGVAREVVERVPPSHDKDFSDDCRPIPSRWSPVDKANGLELLGDGSEVRFTGVQLKTPDDAAGVRADHPIPREIGLYYYEITVVTKHTKDILIGVGFASKKTSLARYPGWENDSFAFHSDDGHVFSGNSNTGRPYGPRWENQDVIGCGINFRTNTIFFTRNGVLLGTASDFKAHNLYPAIGLKKPSEHIRTNFGRYPFVFDIDFMMLQERQLVLNMIKQQDVSKLHPPDDEASLIQNLIGQYLAHEGFVETSRAFQRDLREHKRTAPSTSDVPMTEDNTEDDVHARNRQTIRRALLDGDVDRALKYTNLHYPQLLSHERNKDIYFRLKCRKFIEMMRRYSDLHSARKLAGELDSDPTGEQDTQMELDDQIQREAARDQAMASAQDDVDMELSEYLPHAGVKHEDLQLAVLEYGQALRAEFDDNPSPNMKSDLDNMFAMLAYNDPRSSPIGHLLDPTGRSSIAEELNGAILVSLGKPSSAALEKLCSQTESYLDDVARKTGGASAFVNVREDFLQA